MCKNKNEELLPYYKRARKLLSYDPETGVLTWKIRVARNIKAGYEAGSINSSGYRNISISINGKRKSLKAHRISWFIYYNEMPNVMDHINEIKDDNRIINLRSCTNQENQFNRRKPRNNTSGFKGVYLKDSNGKYVAQININGKRRCLGLFDTAEEASEIYQQKAMELHGDYYNNKK